MGCGALFALRENLSDRFRPLPSGSGLHQLPGHQPHHMIQEPIPVIIQYDQVISGSMNIDL